MNDINISFAKHVPLPWTEIAPWATSELIVVVTSILIGATAVFGLYSIVQASRQHRQRALFDALGHISNHIKELEIVFFLEGKSLQDWLPEERYAAVTIAFDFHHLGALIKTGVMRDELCELYYYAIPTTWRILQPLVQEVRNARHPAYWRKFEELVETTKRRNRGTAFELP